MGNRSWPPPLEKPRANHQYVQSRILIDELRQLAPAALEKTLKWMKLRQPRGFGV
jgi:hypothetical protein